MKWKKWKERGGTFKRRNEKRLKPAVPLYGRSRFPSLVNVVGTRLVWSSPSPSDLKQAWARHSVADGLSWGSSESIDIRSGAKSIRSPALFNLLMIPAYMTGSMSLMEPWNHTMAMVRASPQMSILVPNDADCLTSGAKKILAASTQSVPIGPLCIFPKSIILAFAGEPGYDGQ